MKICDNCAMRLYTNKSCNLQGIGNPFYGNAIIIPNMDYKTYKNKKKLGFSAQVSILQSILLTGVEDLNCFILPSIRCDEQIFCELDKTSYKNCLALLAHDIKKYQLKDILLLGTAAMRFLNISSIKEYLNTMFISKNNIRYYCNYSPLVNYYNKDLVSVFQENLIKWHNSVTNKSFNYKIIRL